MLYIAPVGSMTNFSNLPQNLKNLLNTYQFWWKYPPKTYLLIRKNLLFLVFRRSRSVVCFYGVRAKGMLQIKLWTLGLIKKIYKQTIALFIKLFRFNWPYILINAFLTQIPFCSENRPFTDQFYSNSRYTYHGRLKLTRLVTLLS